MSEDNKIMECLTKNKNCQINRIDNINKILDKNDFLKDKLKILNHFDTSNTTSKYNYIVIDIDNNEIIYVYGYNITNEVKKLVEQSKKKKSWNPLKKKDRFNDILNKIIGSYPRLLDNAIDKLKDLIKMFKLKYKSKTVIGFKNSRLIIALPTLNNINNLTSEIFLYNLEDIIEYNEEDERDIKNNNDKGIIKYINNLNELLKKLNDFKAIALQQKKDSIYKKSNYSEVKFKCSPKYVCNNYKDLKFDKTRRKLKLSFTGGKTNKQKKLRITHKKRKNKRKTIKKKRSRRR